MAESTLSIGWSDLVTEVASFLGYNSDPDLLTPNELAAVDRAIQGGIRQFYYPAAVPGVETGHEWSFMKPNTTITTADEDGEQDLPDDFGRLTGDFNYSADLRKPSVPLVSEHQIMALLADDSNTGYPSLACIRFKSSDGSDGQRQEVVWYPIPSGAYELSYSYEAFPQKLTEDNPYPLGGMKYSELVIESCLAIAEQRQNDVRGQHTERFEKLLIAAISQDRRNGAIYYGPLSSGELSSSNERCGRASGTVSYKGETW